MSTPAHFVAEFIVDNVPGLTLGTNVFVGLERLPKQAAPSTAATPALCVFVSNDTGLDAVNFKDGGRGRRELLPTVRIVLRGEKNDPRGGQELAELLRDLVHQSKPGPLSWVVVLGSGSMPWIDDDGFPRWLTETRVHWDAPTFSMRFGRAPVGSTIDEAFVLALPTEQQRRWRTTVVELDASADAGFVALPAVWDTSTAFPLRAFDGIAAVTPIETTLRGTVDIDGVPYSVRSFPLSSSAHVVKLY